jgi:hypothetical protein
MGIRVNAEGAIATADGQADLGAMVFHYRDASSVEQTWQSAYAVPYRLLLSPEARLVKNLPGLDVACGNPVLPVAPESPYTLEVPMSVTGSADHAGYATVVFLDRQCRGLARAFLYFTPSSKTLDLPVTDAKGQIQLMVPLNLSRTQLRAYYSGDNAAHRPSMATMTLGEKTSP